MESFILWLGVVSIECGWVGGQYENKLELKLIIQVVLEWYSIWWVFNKILALFRDLWVLEDMINVLKENKERKWWNDEIMVLKH